MTLPQVMSSKGLFHTFAPQVRTQEEITLQHYSTKLDVHYIADKQIARRKNCTNYSILVGGGGPVKKRWRK